MGRKTYKRWYSNMINDLLCILELHAVSDKKEDYG